MAYTDPPTFVGGVNLPEDQLNILSDDIRALYGVSQGVTFSGVKLSRATAQSIPNTTPTDIVFSTEAWDYGAWWSSGATITDPASSIPDGRTTIALLAIAAIRFVANGTGTRGLYINKNGSTEDFVSVSALSGETTYVTLVSFITAEAGDEITFQAYQSSGGALNMDSAKVTVVRFLPVA